VHRSLHIWAFPSLACLRLAHTDRGLLDGDSVPDPLPSECLDFDLLMVCTWSRTRCWPDRYWLTDGIASDVSSTFPMEITDFRGSEGVIVIIVRSVRVSCGTTSAA